MGDRKYCRYFHDFNKHAQLFAIFDFFFIDAERKFSLKFGKSNLFCFLMF